MRSTRNKEFIAELRQYIADSLNYDDAQSQFIGDQMKAMVNDALIPWTRGNVRRNSSIGWRQFMDFEQANLDFDYATYKQEAWIKRWLRVDKLSRYMLAGGVDAKFYSMLFPVFDAMLLEYTGKTFAQTVKEAIA